MRICRPEGGLLAVSCRQSKLHQCQACGAAFEAKKKHAGLHQMMACCTPCPCAPCSVPLPQRFSALILQFYENKNIARRKGRVSQSPDSIAPAHLAHAALVTSHFEYSCPGSAWKGYFRRIMWASTCLEKTSQYSFEGRCKIIRIYFILIVITILTIVRWYMKNI